MKRSMVSLAEPKEFQADHPYVYAINCKTFSNNAEMSYPLFVGTVLSLEQSAAAVSEAHDEL